MGTACCGLIRTPDAEERTTRLASLSSRRGSSGQGIGLMRFYEIAVVPTADDQASKDIDDEHHVTT